MHVDPWGAHTVLGGVAALRGDTDGACNHHRIALQHDTSLTSQFNFSVSLSVLEQHGEALAVARKALEDYPDDLRLLGRAITAAIESASFATASALVARWDALSPHEPHPMASAAKELAVAIDAGIFEESGVRAVLQIVADVQRRDGVRTRDCSIRRHNDPPSFLYERVVHAPAARASALNQRIADRITARADLMADPGLRFVAMR